MGHGCDEWYTTPSGSTVTPDSSRTSRRTASSSVSPGSTKPARHEKRPGGHLACLTFLFEELEVGYVYADCMEHAVGMWPSRPDGPHMEMVLWLLDHRPAEADAFNSDALEEAASRDHREVLVLAKAHGCFGYEHLTQGLCEMAAGGGHLALLEWLCAPEQGLVPHSLPQG